MKPVKVHPKITTSIILWGDDGNEEHTLVKGKNCVGSVIGFDKRQIWEVYPYKKYSSDTRYYGECERNGVCIRLMPKDFCRIFGTAPFDAQAESEDKHTEERTKTHACDCNTRRRTHACDCISRQAALEVFDDYAEDIESGNLGIAYSKARMSMCAAPSVEPERKTGKWEYVVSTADVYGKWVCSECNKLIIGSSTQKPQHNYCPDCGADMREVDNGRTD